MLVLCGSVYSILKAALVANFSHLGLHICATTHICTALKGPQKPEKIMEYMKQRVTLLGHAKEPLNLGRHFLSDFQQEISNVAFTEHMFSSAY